MGVQQCVYTAIEVFWSPGHRSYEHKCPSIDDLNLKGDKRFFCILFKTSFLKTAAFLIDSYAFSTADLLEKRTATLQTQTNKYAYTIHDVR